MENNLRDPAGTVFCDYYMKGRIGACTRILSNALSGNQSHLMLTKLSLTQPQVGYNTTL